MSSVLKGHWVLVCSFVKRGWRRVLQRGAEDTTGYMQHTPSQHRLTLPWCDHSRPSPSPHLSRRQLLGGLLLVHECPGHVGQGFCSDRGGEGRSCVRVILNHFGEREGLGHGKLGTAQPGLNGEADRDQMPVTWIPLYVLTPPPSWPPGFPLAA